MRIRISYDSDYELRHVLNLLRPITKRVKVATDQDDVQHKKAYLTTISLDSESEK